MKKIVITILVLLSCLNLFSQNKIDTLTNADIIQLTKVGLQPSVIVTKIQSSVTKFDISTNALINLSKDNVSSDVINEMMKSTNQKQTSQSIQVDVNDPNIMHSPGIFYFDQNDQNKSLKKLYATVVSSSQSNGVAMYGIGSGSARSYLSGEKSRTQINQNSPVFYFYIQHSTNPGAENWWFASAETPNEFVLVELYETGESRFFKTGSSSTIGGISSGQSSGIPEKDKVAFEMTEISDGIFKVYFNEPLDGGEYCFVYGGSAPSMYNNNKVFDFGILNELSKDDKAKISKGKKNKSKQVY
ncbi:MAG: hypothetical protein NTU44_13480 [Bacteroidetes bacterium]|nr:hypothetical protein [Bacteroidota bacterium]